MEWSEKNTEIDQGPRVWKTLREFALKGFVDQPQGKGKPQLRTLAGTAWLTPGETGLLGSCSEALSYS